MNLYKISNCDVPICLQKYAQNCATRALDQFSCSKIVPIFIYSPSCHSSVNVIKSVMYKYIHAMFQQATKHVKST